MKFSKKEIYPLIISIHIIFFFNGCKKIGETMENTYISISSPETRLTNGSWKIRSISKNGSVIHSVIISPVCGMESPSSNTGIDFDGNGVAGISCRYLNPDSLDCSQGTWQIKDKKNIEIQIQYECTLSAPGTVTPMPTKIINWGIKKLNNNELKAQEIKTDGTYEYTFIH